MIELISRKTSDRAQPDGHSLANPIIFPTLFGKNTHGSRGSRRGVDSVGHGRGSRVDSCGGISYRSRVAGGREACGSSTSGDLSNQINRMAGCLAIYGEAKIDDLGIR